VSLYNSRHYLYMRTRLALTSDIQKVIDILTSISDEADVLYLRQELPWINGIVARFYTEEDVEDIINDLKDELDKLDMWAIYAGNGRSYEPHGGGAIGMFIGNAANTHLPVAQVFVRYRDWERDPDSVADDIKRALRSDVRSVFHFQNGRILMVRSKEPPNLIVRRLENIRRRVHSAAVVDAEGKTRDLPDLGSLGWGAIP